MVEQQQTEQRQRLYIASYTVAVPHILGDKLGKGVTTLELAADGTLTQIGEPAEMIHPSYVCVTPDNKYLFAAHEHIQYKDEMNKAWVSAHSINQETGALTYINEAPSEGGATCFVEVNQRGDRLICGNYMGGNVGLFTINADGSITPNNYLTLEKPESGWGPDKDRQEKSHAHNAIWSGNDAVLVSDLGADVIQQLVIKDDKLAYNSSAPMNQSVKNIKPGAGPRHMAIHPSQKYAYGLSEMGSIVTVYNHSNGVLTGPEGQTCVQTISTLPEGWTGVKEICKSVKYNHTAHIMVSPDGKFVYGSNRGHESIVVYSVNQEDGTLTLVEFTDVEGSIPRNFSISPDGEYLVVACQDTHTVGSFKIDKATGKLTSTGKRIEIGSPVCVCFLNKV